MEIFIKDICLKISEKERVCILRADLDGTKEVLLTIKKASKGSRYCITNGRIKASFQADCVTKKDFSLTKMN